MDDHEAAQKVLRTAEAAARGLVAEAAVVAAKLKAEASNGQHDQLRADIKAVKEDVGLIRKSLSEVSECVLTLQHGQLRMLGVASLLGGIVIFVLSRALGL